MYSLSHTKNLSDRTSSCIPIWFIFLWFLFSIVLPFAVYFFLSSQFQVHAVDVCNPIQFIKAWRLRIVIRCGCVIWAIDWSENSAWIHLIWLFMESRMLRSPAKPPLNHDYRLRIYRHCNLYTRVFVNMSLLSSFSHSHTLKHSHLCLSLILLSLRERESMHINWSFVGNGFSFRFSVYHFVGMSLLSSLWFFLRNHIGLGSSHNASPFSSSSPTFCYGIFALSAFPSLARTLLHMPNPNYFNGCLRSSLSL